MAFLIGRKIGLGFALAVTALVVVGTVAYRNFKVTLDNVHWVTHTVEVLLQLETVSEQLKDLESNARGYLLNGDEELARGFVRISSDLDHSLNELSRSTTDNPAQHARLQKLIPLIAQRKDSSRRLMVLRASEIAGREAQSMAIVREGTQLTQQIQSALDTMRQEENRLLLLRQDASDEKVAYSLGVILYGTGGAIVVMLIVALLVTRSITSPLQNLQRGAAIIGQGNYAHRVKVDTHDEVSHLAEVFNEMARLVQERQQRMADQDWLKSGMAEINSLVQGQRDVRKVASAVLSELARRLEAAQLSFYFRHANEDRIHLSATYAAERLPEEFGPGQGPVGQCLVEGKRIKIDAIPEKHWISTSLGQTKPVQLWLQPVLFENQVKGVIELATMHPLTELQLTLLDQVAAMFGIILVSIEASERTDELLRESRKLSGQLQEQQEELRQSNEELEQANDELRQTTIEMEEKAALLGEQKKELELRGQQIENARAQLELQTQKLERASKYKSDFLASMSHELRTPLNSLLILSKMLADNPEGTLTAKQVQYASTIQSSGQDLLELINDILDLSKIEAGQIQLERETVSLNDLVRFSEATFRPMADQKHLGFHLSLAPECPETIETDQRRLEQIVKNLLSNAFKFTEHGSVDLKIAPFTPARAAGDKNEKEANYIALSVTDTGIGIPEDKQELVFEAFRQADAGTSRRYGGTGLGLSISRELARLLGGKIQLESEVGRGSTFTLIIPTTLPPSPNSTPRVDEARPYSAQRATRRAAPTTADATSPQKPDPLAELEKDPVDDDRHKINPGDLVLLIIEDDRAFARLLVDFAREKKFKAVVAATASRGIALAQQFVPAAITLDLRLPDQDGWVVIDWLKHQPELRRIPVHIISVEEERDRSLRLGAVSFLQKPITREAVDTVLSDTLAFINRPVKELLIIEDDPTARSSMVELINSTDVHTTAVGTAKDALEAIGKQAFDCIVVDLILPDTKGTELLKEIHRRCGPRTPPIIIYTGKDLSPAEETELRMVAESIIVKSVRSPERLLDESALFLHRIQSKLPSEKQKLIEQGQKTDPVLAGRKVLIVDDDVRNIFAITAALENYQVKVVYAESGRSALQLLEESNDIDLVLMDVMMPDMDGYETTREIRKNPRFKNLPIISVTAKAMKGDREKCIEAGASDYITKPVDMDKLRSLLRVWLYR
ncbi:MAG TPA: response regulator [Opitutaceae bacterium]|nr:response regulator [Opitutaceae bacterium]